MAQQTTAEKLTELGFSDAIYAPLIAHTAKVMHREIESRPDLADRVFDTIRDALAPYLIEERYEVFLENWVKEQATALHNEQARAWLTPFRVMASLFD